MTGEDFRALANVFNATPHRVECGWCHETIRPGREPVSHGICAACAKQHFPGQLAGIAAEQRKEAARGG